MQRVRAMFVLLTVLVTAITAIGMEMMPISVPAANMGSDAASHASHNSNTRPDDGHHDSDDCPYCHLAKATDLPPRHGGVTVHRRPPPRFAGVQAASCYLPARTTPCQPRAPPQSVTA